jgi:VanZ family protein
MGKREVRVIAVPKWATLLLLVLVTGGMLGLVYFLSGRAYAPEASSLTNLAVGIFRREAVPSRNVVLAALMPAAANALLFLPWGFLCFLLLDRPSRPRWRTYLYTVAAGTALALAGALWQSYLPTRVTSLADMLANGGGVFLGAAVGHLRKQVHVRFDY